MKLTDEQIENVRRFLQSPVSSAMIDELRNRYILAFRGSRDINERIVLAAKLDATDELLRVMEGVLEDIEVDNV